MCIRDRTREMGKVAENVVAIEIDKTLIPILKETLADLDLSLIHI